MVVSSISVNETFRVLPNPYALTIKPRLEYSICLTGMIIEKLEQEYAMMHKTNSQIYAQNEESEDLEFKKQLGLESNLICAIDVLNLVQSKIRRVSRISHVCEHVLPFVFMIRMISSNLYDNVSQTRNDLVELSVCLGSIVLDSGSLLEVKLDFKQTNLESKQILDEVNLIAESKIHKQYPKLNF